MHPTPWMNLGNKMLSENRQDMEDHLLYGSASMKFPGLETHRQEVGLEDWGDWEMIKVLSFFLR